MDVTFSNLKKKDVINVKTGKNLGKVIDLSFDYPNGVICNFTVSNCKFSLFGSGSTTQIALENIKKIGEDVILVDTDPPKQLQQTGC